MLNKEQIKAEIKRNSYCVVDQETYWKLRKWIISIYNVETIPRIDRENDFLLVLPEWRLQKINRWCLAYSRRPKTPLLDAVDAKQREELIDKAYALDKKCKIFFSKKMYEELKNRALAWAEARLTADVRRNIDITISNDR